MKNEFRTPEKLFSEIADYIITRYDTADVNSQIRVTPNIKTIMGIVSYDFAADFVLQYHDADNRLTLIMTSRKENDHTTSTTVYTMTGENTVQVSESWDGEEAEVKTYDNQNFMQNVTLGMTYVHSILAFIENLA